MGCSKLHIENEPTLILVYSKKVQKLLKISLSYYPFGLQQQEPNDTVTSNANSTAKKLKYNKKTR